MKAIRFVPTGERRSPTLGEHFLCGDMPLCCNFKAMTTSWPILRLEEYDVDAASAQRKALVEALKLCRERIAELDRRCVTFSGVTLHVIDAALKQAGEEVA